jgi:hypothetical protein
MKKKKRSTIYSMGMGAVGLSVGSSVLGGIGGTAAEYGQKGISNAASYLPVTGTILGGGLAIGALNSLTNAVPRKPYAYRRSNTQAIRRRRYKVREASITD